MFAARGGFVNAAISVTPFPAWPTVPTWAEMNSEFDTNFVSTANATAANINVTNTGTIAFRHAIGADNGNIYILPRNNANVLCYNTNDNTITRISTISGTGQYQGGALAPNGNIYMFPHETATSNSIFEFSTTTHAYRQITGVANMPSTRKYQAGMTLPDGKLFFVNFDNTANCLIYDPVANAITRTSLLAAGASNNLEFISGVVHPNGKVYMTPYNGTNMVEYDPTTDTTRRFNFGSTPSLTGSGKFSGAAIGADNRIYFLPFSSNDILVYDPMANTAFRSSYSGAVVSGSNKYATGQLGADGNIYCMPYGSSTTVGNAVLVVDTQPDRASYNTAFRTNFGITMTASSKWWGGGIGRNNKHVGAPENSGNVLIITTSGNANGNAMLSPFINKGG
jgi:hypothetical protein